MTSNAAKTLMVLSCLAVASCNPAGIGGADSNLDCAALISAADTLVRKGKAEKDPVLAKRALGSLAWHMNSYAIPKRIKEREAAEQVKSLRAALIESRPPAEIMSRARRCADRAPR